MTGGKGFVSMRAVEVLKLNKQHYETARAQALLQSKTPVAGFRLEQPWRSLLTQRAGRRDKAGAEQNASS